MIKDFFKRKDKFKELFSKQKKFSLNPRDALYCALLVSVFIFICTLLIRVNKLESELKNFETVEFLCNGDCLLSPEIIKYMQTDCSGCILEEEDME